MDWKQGDLAATLDQHLLVGGTVEYLPAVRLMELDLHSAMTLLYGRISVEKFSTQDCHYQESQAIPDRVSLLSHYDGSGTITN